MLLRDKSHYLYIVYYLNVERVYRRVQGEFFYARDVRSNEILRVRHALGVQLGGKCTHTREIDSTTERFRHSDRLDAGARVPPGRNERIFF